MVRNKVRRRLKDIFSASAPGNMKIDIVVSSRPASAEASYDELRVEFLRALKKFEARDWATK